MYFFQKNQQFWFSPFLRPPPLGGDFWPIWPPYPHPMGHPTQLPTRLPTFMFFVSNEPKNDAWSWKFNCFSLFSKWWVVNQFWPFLAFCGHLSVRRAVRGWLKNVKRGFPLIIHMVTRAKTSAEHVQSILCNSWTRHRHSQPQLDTSWPEMIATNFSGFMNEMVHRIHI